MIINELRKETARSRGNIYSLFNAEGKGYLSSLLKEERELFDQLELNYETPELRKWAHLASKGRATQEQLDALSSARKSFAGRTAYGIIKEPEVISLVNQYLANTKLLDMDIKTLGDNAPGTSKQFNEVILGKDMSFWNLHPAALYQSIYESLFSKNNKEYLLSELYRLYKLKAYEGEEVESVPIYDKTNDRPIVEGLLMDLIPIYKSKDEVDELVTKLLNLNTVGNLTPGESKLYLEKLLKLTVAADVSFDFSIWEKTRDILPQYNCYKTKFIVHCLAQFNKASIVYINPQINADDITAFIRKVDELL